MEYLRACGGEVVAVWRGGVVNCERVEWVRGEGWREGAKGGRVKGESIEVVKG